MTHQKALRYHRFSYRRFLINLIFFLVYPCVLCCRCFERSINEEDEDGSLQDFQGRGDDERDRLLQQHGLLKGARVVQKQVPLSTTSIATTTTSADEEDVLGDGWDSAGGGGAGNRKQLHSEEIATTDDDELSKLLAGMQSEAEEVQQTAKEGARRSGGRPYYNNTEDEDNDTRFVLDVMNQSRKSLQTARRPRYSSKHANRGHPPYHTDRKHEVLAELQEK
ncbi:uncharacterized protein LOC5568728 [Aedes aegypti]|uniref:Uncharacterized protein n=1 Tax=Aedes aegypti TaxID=7159 RepID=A0A903VGL3_AEDAE|nr:uncharacterized protein LOC5568728 [Aedes aegypti]